MSCGLVHLQSNSRLDIYSDARRSTDTTMSVTGSGCEAVGPYNIGVRRIGHAAIGIQRHRTFASIRYRGGVDT